MEALIPRACSCLYPARTYDTASEHDPKCPVQVAWMRSPFVAKGYPEPDTSTEVHPHRRTWTIAQLKRGMTE